LPFLVLQRWIMFIVHFVLSCFFWRGDISTWSLVKKKGGGIAYCSSAKVSYVYRGFFWCCEQYYYICFPILLLSWWHRANCSCSKWERLEDVGGAKRTWQERRNVLVIDVKMLWTVLHLFFYFIIKLMTSCESSCSIWERLVMWEELSLPDKRGKMSHSLLKMLWTVIHFSFPILFLS